MSIPDVPANITGPLAGRIWRNHLLGYPRDYSDCFGTMSFDGGDAPQSFEPRYVFATSSD